MKFIRCQTSGFSVSRVFTVVDEPAGVCSHTKKLQVGAVLEKVSLVLETRKYIVDVYVPLDDLCCWHVLVIF